MAHSGRSLSSNLRHPSLSQPGSGNNPSPALVARINEKRLELESYRELRDLSAQLAEQMQSLQDKLATVAGGAEAVAMVLSNWQDVLNAIKMASSMLYAKVTAPAANVTEVKMPKPAESSTEADTEVQLPQTLIRIPVQHQPKEQA